MIREKRRLTENEKYDLLVEFNDFINSYWTNSDEREHKALDTIIRSSWKYYPTTCLLTTLLDLSINEMKQRMSLKNALKNRVIKINDIKEVRDRNKR